MAEIHSLWIPVCLFKEFRGQGWPLDAGTQKITFLTKVSQCIIKSQNAALFGFDVFISHEKFSEFHALSSMLCTGSHRAE